MKGLVSIKKINKNLREWTINLKTVIACCKIKIKMTDHGDLNCGQLVQQT